ncbi:hypothetical protein IW140_005757 [Coemansia sp. RSA 1813]|nr:hypothetical protein EV178_002177 [Coemansia sp. RSA 1646]KAJ1767245.1 hypothetical protein LPJ74_005487 [Coemansia sp. RSA 1843]KAJ2090323.1 hypothetical protein IW138_002749 [Coemansia sp. RSA 986]KAJ2215513.1 hypothetical protein EV179_002106 [Coemansia sp. RSA 487]KAJ2564419.1 hypothetical protein IW140_005757 [Coemansia sp. RSA 1813]
MATRVSRAVRPFMRIIALLAVTLLLLQCTCVHAKPLFNSVNKYDANGNLCPLRERTGELCPQVCVSDVALCPEGFGDDNCPNGQKLCIDGTCSADCGNILARKNPCGCTFQYPPEQAKFLVPCAAFGEVTIEQYNKDDISQTIDFCTDKFNVSGSMPIWGDWDGTQEGSDGSQIDGRRFWTGDQCPTAPKYYYTYHEPLWIGVFSCVGAEALVLLIWMAYKFIREIPVRRLRHREAGFTTATSANVAGAPSSGNDSEKTSLTKDIPDEKKGKAASSSSSKDDDEDADIHIKGYNNDFLGWIGFASIILTSLGWIIWLGFWIGDYYGTLGEADSLALYNSALLDETFIPIWIFAVAWTVTCCVFLDRIRNFFRIECLPSEGQYVQIERDLKELKMATSTSKFVAFAKLVEERFVKLIKADVFVTTCKVKQLPETKLRYFNYMCTRYVFNEKTKQYGPYLFDMGETHRQIHTHSKGLTSQEAATRLSLIGPNFISVYVPSYPLAFVLELANFFYLYQLMIQVIYWYWNYYVIGIIDTCIILLSAIVKVFVRIRGELRVKRMAEHSEVCTIFRDNEWQELSTIDLVPGDIFKVVAGMHVPCDAIVLGGNIVVDESSLTGEPLPIRKFPIHEDDGVYDKSGAGKINTLYAGTSISQSQEVTTSDGSISEPIGICLHTGTQTDKGQLVQQILFPQPISFIFDEQLRLVFGILIIYAIIVFVLAMVFYQTKPSAAWFYAMFSSSQLISPLIPAALVMGQSVAAGRLKNKKIYCVNLPRIIMAGKVQMFCFDKTGTLTKEGLEFYGGLCAQTASSSAAAASGDSQISTISFSPFVESFDELPDKMRTAAATCHAVAEVEGGLMIGNPVDIEMFRTTKCKISKTPTVGALDTIVVPEEGDSGYKLDIVKRFEFLHARASMSVAVRDPRDGHVHVFVKGSFEKVKEHLDSSTVPSDYLAAANSMARRGGYVLAIGHRDLGDIDVSEMQNWTRDDMENGSAMVGFIVFKNMLKEDTPEAIAKLKEGSTRTVMITGDTALTGVFIAKSAGLMSEKATVYLGDLDKSGELYWVDVDKEEPVDQSQIDRVISKTTDGGDYELAMTGKAFNRLDEIGMIRQYVLHTRVFARMLPNDKVNCVQLHMERGFTAMCGDGGNDCGALRAAHVGLALSDAEASIVSPFSSSDRSINSCVELLIQGRSALATSFAGYLYLILYGQTMTFLKIFSFYFSNTASSNTWIWIDAFINTIMSICVAYSGPAKKLSKHRPTARILGPQVMTTAGGTVAINFIFLACSFAWLYNKQWFRCNEFDSSSTDIAKWWLLADNYEASVLAIVCLFQFVNNAMVVNFGYYFRRRWYRNYALIFLWAVYVAIVSIVLLAKTNWLGCRFRINCGSKDALASDFNIHPSFYIEDYNNLLGHNVIPTDSRYELWGICIGNMCATVLWQLVVALYPVHSWTRKKRPLRRLKVKL